MDEEKINKCLSSRDPSSFQFIYKVGTVPLVVRIDHPPFSSRVCGTVVTGAHFMNDNVMKINDSEDVNKPN